jgi:hypothetical protein
VIQPVWFAGRQMQARHCRDDELQPSKLCQSLRKKAPCICMAPLFTFVANRIACLRLEAA